ncbi:pseudo histidine-containing phosphotransfer protein 5-like isoform X2 [Vigna umbellata]|uniref:pseudo histidine-containing phosphotransfer protein 5-like isoform X2 n=1 Tax=Vigna umbellata TaxID=87088 RepID=UPI001F5F106C|nr:pseudo histidine-containing phosphotransfer protein 5-like isoform X2 [Vigna umbellata]
MSSLSNWKNCRMMLILTLLRKLLLFTTVILLGLSQTWTTHCNLLNQPRHTLSLTDFICFCMFSASVLFILSKYVGVIHDRERNPLDFNKLDTIMHQFKGSSSSIGAKKVKAECTLFREYCRTRNGEGCRRSFQQMKKEYAILRKKLETYFQMARQAGPKETAFRPK